MKLNKYIQDKNKKKYKKLKASILKNIISNSISKNAFPQHSLCVVL